ncbi:protein terminal ear1 homolog [Cynara cardunculus var. scolymus]|uniref:protein terminal ear1 homolog n=1 Tax=Cynara cardunculus var. scolymus TaxID=59895 RepID=UPI000D62379A|nr:protein terminal ear1 homolog [Cynara cardunculus var. scolymus]
MEDTTYDRFAVTLDPSAQEFRPTYPLSLPPPLPNTYYSYNFYSPPPPLPPPPAAVYATHKQPSLPPPLPPPSTTPTRTLLLSSVPSDVSESIIRRDLEVFGDVRAVQMEKVRDGIVTVHFYDLRQSTEALHEIQEQHMQQQCRLRKHFDSLTLSSPSPSNNSVPPYNYHTNSYLSPPLPPPAPGLIAGRAVWAQFTFPAAAGLPDGYNQGTIVVFNLDSDVTAGTLKEIFEAYGCVKELRGTPLKKNQRFVEFYDTRDAAKALMNMNGKEIHGKTVVVEFSRPGGHKFPSDSLAYRRPSPPPPPSLKKTGKKQPENVGGGAWSKQRKGSRQTRERYDPRFLIKEDGIISESSFSDSRTTVMIKNIPNKYSQKLLLNMLDNHCIHCNEQIAGGSGGDQPLSSYDFVYLPIDFMNKCNVGYGFVNMTSPEATWRLYKAFHHQNWEVFNSKKICEVSYARLQGVDALKEHFKNSRFPCEAEEYMPVVFEPPRDGRKLTEPTPIVGRSMVEVGSYSSSNNEIVVEDVNSDNSNSDGGGDGGGGDFMVNTRSRRDTSPEGQAVTESTADQPPQTTARV